MKASNGTQQELRLAFGVHRAPVDAPAKVLRQIESEAMALAVSMKAGGHKLASVAAAIGKSEGYVSRMRKGLRPIPHRLVGPLCGATGSNLLRQYIDLQRALEGACEVTRLAEQLRAAA
ncbi:hypothetical protein [Luteimonas saliphila]|uniref:hypothetical protein n=1 Tax=Luteimonas saliphila TaxID=2804919 RepID=UPI00192D6B0F|nr:hypothetical protein [Luteimonas saliphila]